MSRAIVIMLDSFGVGYTEDAVRFSDVGANTFGHIVEACEKGNANREGLRSGALCIPHLLDLGLGHVLEASSKQVYPSLHPLPLPIGAYGYAEELSSGKDTPSGHWEMAGVPVLFDWGYFLSLEKSFPETLLSDFLRETKLPGFLGNCHASGTEIIQRLGEEHIRSGKPIVYTSADSVFQIAAHETHFGLERLYAVCEVVRKLVDAYNIGRVIARPFVGEKEGAFMRTGNRRDYATPPPSPTLLDHVIEAGGTVVAIGKVADIYAHQGISKTLKADGNEALMETLLNSVNEDIQDVSLIFCNLVDFDSSYGHRRDVAGYAHALEVFDRFLPRLLAALKEDDILCLTADHGCDPTWPGSDHTREHVPVLCVGKSIAPKALGKRKTFADLGQTIAAHLRVKPLAYGESFL